MGQSREKTGVKVSPSKTVISLAVITVAFISGRLFQYFILDINSSIETNPGLTILWSVATGLVVATVLFWFSLYVQSKSKINRIIVLGLIFSVYLLLFNFFIPLIFDVDIVDLVMRTAADVLGVTIGIVITTLTEKPLLKK